MERVSADREIYMGAYQRQARHQMTRHAEKIIDMVSRPRDRRWRMREHKKRKTMHVQTIEPAEMTTFSFIMENIFS